MTWHLMWQYFVAGLTECVVWQGGGLHLLVARESASSGIFGTFESSSKDDCFIVGLIWVGCLDAKTMG